MGWGRGELVTKAGRGKRLFSRGYIQGKTGETDWQASKHFQKNNKNKPTLQNSLRANGSSTQGDSIMFKYKLGEIGFRFVW